MDRPDVHESSAGLLHEVLQNAAPQEGSRVITRCDRPGIIWRQQRECHAHGRSSRSVRAILLSDDLSRVARLGRIGVTTGSAKHMRGRLSSTGAASSAVSSLPKLTHPHIGVGTWVVGQRQFGGGLNEMQQRKGQAKTVIWTEDSHKELGLFCRNWPAYRSDPIFKHLDSRGVRTCLFW
jgi:hypothetical protein